MRVGRRVVGRWKWDVVEGWGDGGGGEEVNGSEGGAREEQIGPQIEDRWTQIRNANVPLIASLVTLVRKKRGIFLYRGRI